MCSFNMGALFRALRGGGSRFARIQASNRFHPQIGESCLKCSFQMIALSSRLEAVLTAAGPCGLVAGVCADHALVALAAVARGAATHAVAVELRRAPLAQAARYLRSSGLERRVLLVRGAGLAAVRRAEVIVVAGVGGDLAAGLLAA